MPISSFTMSTSSLSTVSEDQVMPSTIEIITKSNGLLDDLQKVLECPLCLTLVCEPISTPCGHTFCRVCLVKALRRHQKKCPTCRAVCHMTAEDAQVNIMIKSLSLSINPTLYANRLKEEEAEKSTWTTVLPIFYYNQALFPGCKLSLHLFEPRYKIMMQRIINTSRSFAYVPNYTNYSATVGDVALIAQLEDAEFLSDGRCMLDAKMTSRYTVIDHYVEQGTQGLHFCRLESLVDDPISSEDLEIVTDYRNIASRILQAIFDTRTRSQIEARYGPEPSDISNFSLWMTALTPIPERSKAQWLKSKDTKGRLKYCIEAMTALIASQPPSLESSASSTSNESDDQDDNSMINDGETNEEEDNQNDNDDGHDVDNDNQDEVDNESHSVEEEYQGNETIIQNN